MEWIFFFGWLLVIRSVETKQASFKSKLRSNHVLCTALQQKLLYRDHLQNHSGIWVYLSLALHNHRFKTISILTCLHTQTDCVENVSENGMTTCLVRHWIECLCKIRAFRVRFKCISSVKYFDVLFERALDVFNSVIINFSSKYYNVTPSIVLSVPINNSTINNQITSTNTYLANLYNQLHTHVNAFRIRF